MQVLPGNPLGDPKTVSHCVEKPQKRHEQTSSLDSGNEVGPHKASTAPNSLEDLETCIRQIECRQSLSNAGQQLEREERERVLQLSS